MEQLILDLITKFPVAATILMVIGALRLVLKPMFSIARSVVDFTPSTKDNEVLDKVETSAAYKGLVYVLDWFASVKLPGAK